MRIAFIVKSFPSISETFILNQIIDIAKRGHDVRVFALSIGRQDIVHDAYTRSGLSHQTTYFKPLSLLHRIAQVFVSPITGIGYLLKRRKLNGLKGSRIGRDLWQLGVVKQLTDFLISDKFDVVHAHFGQRGALVADAIGGIGSKTFRFVVSFHGYDLTPSKLETYKIEYADLFKHADVLTVNSEYLLDLLLKVNGRLRNVAILREGLRTDEYQPASVLDKSGQNFLIVFCGRFVAFKGPDIAVRIIAMLVFKRKRRNVKLRMIGDGPVKSKVESLVKELGVSEYVFLLGAQPQSVVREEVSRADVFLLPGRYEEVSGRAEAQGVVVQEAQAAAVPVVVSDAGGTKFGVLDGITGFVVESENVEQYADRIEQLMENSELRKSFGEAGREFVIERFDTEVLGDSLLALYQEGSSHFHA